MKIQIMVFNFGDTKSAIVKMDGKTLSCKVFQNQSKKGTIYDNFTFDTESKFWKDDNYAQQEQSVQQVEYLEDNIPF